MQIINIYQWARHKNYRNLYTCWNNSTQQAAPPINPSKEYIFENKANLPASTIKKG